MKLIILFVSLMITIGTAFSEVPSLINYQGRLTNAEGEPLTGTKNFELKIFDSKTDGKLLYTENVGAIQLAEGGVYSFQFGGKGTSNTQTTEIVGGGDGSVRYQKVLSNTPVVEGSVSVSDGTYTWSQENGSSNEEEFSASYSKSLSRITVNYFGDPPSDARLIEVTYRYQSEGIMGAFGSGSEHWLQLSIDGEVQSTRERVLAVPFALYAGKLAGENDEKVKRYFQVLRGSLGSSLSYHSFYDGEDTGFGGGPDWGGVGYLEIPPGCKRLDQLKFGCSFKSGRGWDEWSKTLFLSVFEFGKGDIYSHEFEPKKGSIGEYSLVIGLDLDPKKSYFLNFSLRRKSPDGNLQFGMVRFYKPVEIHYTE